jgi:hypothetical protein
MPQGQSKSTGVGYTIPLAAAAATLTISPYTPIMGGAGMTQAAPVQTNPSAPTVTVVGVDEKLLNAKLEVVEAHTETQFAKLIGKLDVMNGTLGRVAGDIGELKGAVDRVETKTNNTRIIIVTTIIGATLTILGLTYGIIGYGHQVADSISAAYAAGQGAKK